MFDDNVTEMLAEIRAWSMPRVDLCACATEEGISFCGKREGQWKGLTVADPDMVTCPECRKVLGFPPLMD